MQLLFLHMNSLLEQVCKPRTGLLYITKNASINTTLILVQIKKLQLMEFILTDVYFRVQAMCYLGRVKGKGNHMDNAILINRRLNINRI